MSSQLMAITIQFDPFVVAYCAIVAAVLGLVMGSFINCWAWRSVNGESVAKGRSHCTSCGHELSGRDLIPVISWLASHGKCRYCGEHVSARYPATEVLCAAVYALIVVRYGLTLETVELIAFASILLFISLVDLDSAIIPNASVIAAVAVRVAYLLLAWALFGIDIGDALVQGLIGAAVLGIGVLAVALLMDFVLGRESMGGGDIKLFAVAGFYFGWQQGILLLILSCVIGIVMALVFSPDKVGVDEHSGDTSGDGQEAPAENGAAQAASNAQASKQVSIGEQEVEGAPEDSSRSGNDQAQEAGRIKGRVIPFGPSIAIASVIIMLVGSPIIGWYLSPF